MLDGETPEIVLSLILVYEEKEYTTRHGRREMTLQITGKKFIKYPKYICPFLRIFSGWQYHFLPTPISPARSSGLAPPSSPALPLSPTAPYLFSVSKFPILLSPLNASPIHNLSCIGSARLTGKLITVTQLYLS